MMDSGNKLVKKERKKKTILFFIQPHFILVKTSTQHNPKRIYLQGLYNLQTTLTKLSRDFRATFIKGWQKVNTC